ncbi:hypothetical protein [Thermococcus sp.]|uniref:hypothetical protein n=1 Tax=Thermococcus sp. TaxID=35749 RepID=UPI00260C7FCC|nr:hypothetical protein [Thermococcus sp.]
MRKRFALFLVFIMVFIVISAGCTGNSGVTTQRPTERASPESGYETSSSESRTDETAPASIGELYQLTHVKYFSDGAKWLEIFVDKSRWKSSAEEFHFNSPESAWFYSSGHLYAFEYGGEALYDYAKYNEQRPYPWFILRVPYEPVAFDRAGPKASILILDNEGKLHLVIYDEDKIEEWPSEDDLKVMYFPEIKEEFSWAVGGNRLAVGWDYDENYIYYATWGGNRVWVVGFTNEGLSDLLDGNRRKPGPRVFTFDSPVKAVIVGENGLYVWEGNRLHVFNTLSGPKALEESSTVGVPENGHYHLDFGESSDVLTFYDGNNVLILHLTGDGLERKDTASLPGYDFVGYDSQNWVIFAFKGSQLDFYDYDPDFSKATYKGSLKLPAKAKSGHAFISTEGDAYAYFWGIDGRYYAVNSELNEEGPAGTSGESETGTQTSTRTSGSSTETQTTTSTTAPGQSGSADVLQNPFNVQGINFTRGDYKYFGIKVVPKEGYLMYFPYGDRSYFYQLVSRYVFRIYPYPYDYWNGYSSEPELKVPTPDLLPAEPKAFYGVPNGDDYLLAGRNGKFHILVGYGDETEVNGIAVDTFKTHIAYDFDADGVVIDKNHYEYIAWKGNVLRVYAYTDDEHYAMWDKGKEIRVSPSIYELPEKILEVNPYLDKNFLVVRTEGGLYLIPKPNGYYKDDHNIYRVINGYVKFVGAIHYWGIGALIVYKDGTVYHLDVNYDSDERSMTLTVDAGIEIPNVVGLYGAHSQEPYFVVSTSDGKLLVYDYAWDDTKRAYVFKLAKSYDLGVPLVKFYTDYRPEWKWIKVLGLSDDGTFYNLEISEPKEG